MLDKPEEHFFGDGRSAVVEGETEEGLNVAVAVVEVFLPFESDAFEDVEVDELLRHYPAPPLRTVLHPKGDGFVGPFVLVQMYIDGGRQE